MVEANAWPFLSGAEPAFGRARPEWNLASKILDKSVFIQGTGLPVETRPFFIEDSIKPLEHGQVTLICDGKKYSKCRKRFVGIQTFDREDEEGYYNNR
jgi:hypothetical protein